MKTFYFYGNRSGKTAAFLRGDDLTGLGQASRAGYRAAQHHDMDENPFPTGSANYEWWKRGWLAAANDEDCP